MSNSFPNLTKTKEYIYQWTENKITATFPQIEYINDKIFIEFEKVGHTDIYLYIYLPIPSPFIQMLVTDVSHTMLFTLH